MNKTVLAALLILTTAIGLHAQAEFSAKTLLKPKAPGLFTIQPNLDARTAYDMVGARAGINMVFMPNFKPEVPLPLRVDGQTFFDAMDKLSEQTKNRWFPWDSKTVIVLPDTQQDRRDYEPRVYKTFYLGAGVTNETYTSILTELRSRLQMRGVQQAPQARAIIVYDNATTITAAEQVISELTHQSLPLPSSAPMATPENGTTYLFIAEGGKVRKVVPSTAAHLENMLAGLAIDTNQSARLIYEDLVARVGMNVIFDRQMKDKPAARFHVEGLDLTNTLDLLGLQTATVWQALNESTIYVMDDNQQNRRDRDRFIVKVIYLPEIVTTTRVNETMNMLRTSLSLRGIFQNEERKAIVIRDTPLRVFMAEKVVTDLMKDAGKPTVVSVATDTSSFYTENGWRLGSAKKARPQLEVKLRNKTTVRLVETPKAAFEALVGLAGLKVTFDTSFTDSPEISFNAINVDILDALDLLAWQTRHYWQVVDEHTIRVTPDVQTTRRAQEPTIEKTIVPTNLTNTNGLLNILRTVFGLRSVFLDDKNNILLRDTADNVEMTEKLVEILGQGTTQQ